jgi:hypothetical protein
MRAITSDIRNLPKFGKVTVTTEEVIVIPHKEELKTTIYNKWDTNDWKLESGGRAESAAHTLVFKGGPWDNVQFSAEFAPEEISMKHLLTKGEPKEGGGIRFQFQQRNHHRYKLKDLNDDFATYEYEPENE